MKPILYISLTAWLLLLIAVWAFPIGFTACAKGSFWCQAVYWLTESAGKYGTLLITVGAAYLYTIRLTSKTEKTKVFFRSLLSLLVFLSVFAYINEHGTKKIMKFLRPSHLYVAEHAAEKIRPDSLFALSKEERRSYLQYTIDKNQTSFNDIDAKVLAHWVEESGFSFPSGHSFNAFLLACVLAFSIYSNEKHRKLFFFPFAWALFVCISRVAIGAHSALDVSVGAALGMSIALLFLYFDTTRKLIIHKRKQ